MNFVAHGVLISFSFWGETTTVSSLPPFLAVRADCLTLSPVLALSGVLALGGGQSTSPHHIKE